jgi:quercetin dioxygenase-like cupin family protein
MAPNPPKVLLRSEQTDGHLAIVELTGGGRPPLHRHDFDETFYILEGEITFQLGPPQAAGPIPDVVTLGPSISDDLT